MAGHTPIRKLRASDPLWEAYEKVCRRVFGETRSENLVSHIRQVIREHGNADEIALLEKDEQELEERRGRKGGRPPKN
jgi:hypothetical protein